MKFDDELIRRFEELAQRELFAAFGLPRWVFIPTMAALAACGPAAHLAPPTQFVVLDERFIDATVAALEAMNAARPGLYLWEGEPPAGVEVVRIVATEDGWGPAGGTARNNAGVIYLDAKIRPTWDHLPIVILHELGHLRGLGHSPDPDSVMYYSTQARPHTLASGASDILASLSKNATP